MPSSIVEVATITPCGAGVKAARALRSTFGELGLDDGEAVVLPRVEVGVRDFPSPSRTCRQDTC